MVVVGGCRRWVVKTGTGCRSVVVGAKLVIVVSGVEARVVVATAGVWIVWGCVKAVEKPVVSAGGWTEKGVVVVVVTTVGTSGVCAGLSWKIDDCCWRGGERSKPWLWLKLDRSDGAPGWWFVDREKENDEGEL